MTDKRLTPAATENQRRVLEYVLRNTGCAILPAASTVRANDRSPHNASYNVVWRCVRRGWLKADKAHKTARGGHYSLTITGQGVRELQPSSRQVIAAIGHALRYSEHRDDACAALEAIGYNATLFAADLSMTDFNALRDRLTDGCEDSEHSALESAAYAIAQIAGCAP